MIKVSQNWKKLQTEISQANVEKHKTALFSAKSIPITANRSALVKKYVAIDCEMVGIGSDGTHSVLARVSIVDFEGRVVLDEYVKPKQRVTDFRTKVSGISHHHIKAGLSFEEVQKKVSDILKGKILIGHAVQNDLRVLLISHPHKDIRDTSRYPEFRKFSHGRTPSLKLLAKNILNKDIQDGSHCSVEDACTVMELYKSARKKWESSLKAKNHLKGSSSSPENQL